MAREPEFVLQYLTEVEEKAEDILTDKQQIVDLDKKRNMNREALRAIGKGEAAPVTSKSKTWLNFGGMFIKMETNSAVSMLNSDQQELDKEIIDLRKNLHEKVNELRDAEGKSDLKGFNLKSLSRQEATSLKTSNVINNVS